MDQGRGDGVNSSSASDAANSMDQGRGDGVNSSSASDAANSTPARRARTTMARPPSFLVDRTFDDLNRSGEYSATSGKPVVMVEEELNRERKMRINRESEGRRLAAELTELNENMKDVEKQVRKKLSSSRPPGLNLTTSSRRTTATVS